MDDTALLGKKDSCCGQTQNYGVQKYLESSPKYSCLGHFEARSKRRIAVLSNSITCNRSFSTHFMRFVLRRWCKVYQPPRVPRVVLTPNSQYGRQDPPNLDARKSTDQQSEQSVCRETCRSLLEDTRRKHPGESQLWRYRETCRGNVDYRIPGIPHSTVLKEDANRKDTVKRLIQQFENHPKRNSLIQDLNKN